MNQTPVCRLEQEVWVLVEVCKLGSGLCFGMALHTCTVHSPFVTFVNWQFLSSCGRNCLSLQYAGVIISPIAILFMVYALFMYKRRTVQILRRANVRYDDQSGPVMLVILLIAATLASLVLTAYATLG